MINRYQAIMILGALLIVISSIPIYYSHQESSISYNHINATTCIRVLNSIINGSLTSGRIGGEVIRSMSQSLLISIEVNIEYTNGTSMTYGYYVPIGASGVAIMPMVSGNIEIFGRSTARMWVVITWLMYSLGSTHWRHTYLALVQHL